MLIKHIVCALIVPSLIGSAIIDDVPNAQNEINEMDYNHAPADYYGSNNNNSNEGVRGHTWLDTARKSLSGPAGQMVVHMAKEMISRSTGNSQVNAINENIKLLFNIYVCIRFIVYFLFSAILIDFESQFDKFNDIAIAESIDFRCWAYWRWKLGTICTFSKLRL